MFDDVDRAQDLYRRLSPHLAPRFKKKWEPVGMNERLRLYRYDVGQKFDWHLDGCFERPTGERSFFTFMIYLNEDFEGGTTSFTIDQSSTSTGGVVRVTRRGEWPCYFTTRFCIVGIRSPPGENTCYEQM